MYHFKKIWHKFKLLGLFHVFLMFFAVFPNDAVDVFRAIGEDVVLSLPLVESPIQSVQWNHNGDIAAEISESGVHCFLQFKGRCEVNTTSGELTIKRLELNDSGEYTPEINGKVLNGIKVSVISHINKPSVKTSCNTEKTRCILTCEGNTAEAGPVVYKWFVDGKAEAYLNHLTITKDTKKISFRCLMMNPVSNETSESITNPFAVLVYGAKGEHMILRPPPVTEAIQSIEWKHNADIAAGWYGNKSECLGRFEGRCEVNTGSGALTIKAVNVNDSGIYTPEINGRDSNKTQLSVISHVAKPSVKTSCNTEMTNCNLTCEGSTAEAGPVVCKWFLDGRNGPSGKVLTITKDTKESSFRCLKMNPVSNETSESITNPFRQERDRLISILVPVVIVLVAVIVVAAFFIHKYIIRGRAGTGENGPEHEMDPLNPPPDGEGQTNTTQHPSNGAVASGTQESSIISMTQNGLSGAETETVTPETSNQNQTEAAASNADQETENSVKMPEEKPETNCEPSADEQEADERR